MPTSPRRRGLYAPELLEARIAPATFVVTSLADAGTGSLREAIDGIAGVGGANDSPGADTIVFQIPANLLQPDGTGTIKLTSAEIAIKDTLTIKGPGIDVLTISGDDARRIFNINYTDPLLLSPTTISGLTFIDGKSFADGGAITSVESLTLTKVVVAGSEATAKGGGVSVITTTGKFSMTNSIIMGNKGQSGGGLSIQAAAGISITKSTIANNTATGVGSGVYAFAGGVKATVVFDTCIFTNNTGASKGGGIFVDGLSDGKIILKNSLLSGNGSATTGGGGLYHDSGNLTVSKTTFTGNTGNRGGALASLFGSPAITLVVTGSRFLGNSVTGSDTNGGALYLGGNTPGTFKISGTLFSGNTAGGRGGAITVSGVNSALTLTGCSFLGNSAALEGGAIYVREQAELQMKSSVLSGNHAGTNGGAILASSGDLTITGSKFTENKAASVGGAISTRGVGTFATSLTLSGNLFQGNGAQFYGGAIFARDDTVFKSKSDKFLGNLAKAGGGALYLTNIGGSVLVTGSLFQGNVAGFGGGAIALRASATLTGVKILGNFAGLSNTGGGIAISNGATVDIFKSVITGNVAGGGGGIYKASGSTVNPDDATRARLKGNIARDGANILEMP